MIPVLRRRGDTHAPGGGTSPWLRRTGLLGLAGVIASVALVLLSAGIQASGLPDRVKEVRSGKPLRYDYGNPLSLLVTLAEPRAERVLVRWTSASPPPPPFRLKADVRALTYFGQANGVSVFFEPNAAGSGPGQVYRLPTGSIGTQAHDPGDVPS